MLLDEHLTITRREHFRPIKYIDWKFSLAGFFFLFFALIYIFFSPFKPAELFYFGEFIIIPFSTVLVGVSFFFFLLGGLYALVQRFFSLPLNCSLSSVHLILNIISVIALLWIVVNQVAFIQFSGFGVYKSPTPIFELLVSTQIIFLVNVLLSIFRRLKS